MSDVKADDGKEKKKPSFNPILIYLARRARQKMELERKMLRRDELMKQDLERFLMEIEERQTWVATELNLRNLARLQRLEVIDRVNRDEEKRKSTEELDIATESGLSFYMTSIKENRRFQNSPAKCWDLKGHGGPVHACKLSKCTEYILSCSSDKTMKLWRTGNGKCVATFEGHTKKVFDCDFHPLLFNIEQRDLCLLSCSGDRTLRLWNLQKTQIKIVVGHMEAVYRCQFSPDGSKFVSCSEDQSIRIWCFPDAYLVYVYRGHQSPVTTVSFSPTGRFIVSASDYGERKLMLWHASMPIIEDPVSYPHIIFWNPFGLIKKIIIRKGAPNDTFWLTQLQLGMLGEDVELEMWKGELDPDIEMADTETDSDNSEQGTDSEENDDDESKKKNSNKLGSDDVRGIDGVTIGCVVTDKYGEQKETLEYIPGGSLVVSIQSSGKAVTELFISVHAKSRMFDGFVEGSGQKVGQFLVEAPLPHEMDHAIIDPLGLRAPKRVIPDGVMQSNDTQSLLFKEIRSFDENGEESPFVSKIESVWQCPGPDLGDALVVVNYRLRDSIEWLRLTHSLSESSTRMNTKKADTSENDGAKNDDSEPSNFFFDQESRHISFWNFVREKKWNVVMTFFDKKAVLYEHERIKLRWYRVVDHLENIFGNNPSIILQNPFIFKPGVTKSCVMIENIPVLEDSEEGSNTADDSEVEIIEEDYMDENPTLEDNGTPADENDDGGNAADDGDKNIEVEEQSNEQVASPSNEALDDVSLLSSRSSEVDQLIPIPEEGDDEGSDDNGNDEHVRGVNVEDLPITRDGEATRTLNVGDITYLKVCTTPPTEEGSNLEAPGKYIESSMDLEETLDADMPIFKAASPSDTGKSDKESLTGSIDEAPPEDQKGISDHQNGSTSEEDVEPSSLAARPKAHKLNLREVFFMEDTEGASFRAKVEHCSKLEAKQLIRLIESKVGYLKEMRSFNINPHLEKELVFMESIPDWLKDRRGDFFNDSAKKPHNVRGGKAFSASDESNYNNTDNLLKQGSKNESDRHLLIHFFEIARHNYLKSNKFGPDIDQFTMDLPEAFPHKAGQAVNVLPDALYDYGKLLNKMNEGRLPQSLEEALPKKKIKRAPLKVSTLQNSLREDVRVTLAIKSAYKCTRRFALAELPGMQPHYPNRNYYPDECIPHAYRKDENNQKQGGIDIFRVVFGKKAMKHSKLVPPVGRKPSEPLRRQSIIREYAANPEVYMERAFATDSVRQSSFFSRKAVSVKPSHTHDENANIKGIPPNVYLGRRGSFPLAPGLENLSDISKAKVTESISILKDLEPAMTKSSDTRQVVDSSTLLLANVKSKVKSRIAQDSEEEGGILGLDVDVRSLTAKSFRDLPESTLLKLTDGLLRRFTTNGFELGHHGSINDCVFAPSEARVASAGGDSLIKLWDPRDGTFVRALHGHNHEVQCVRYTIDELFLVSAGSDCEMLIWDLTNNSILRRLRGHHDVVSRISISSDCTFIISSSYDGLLKTWFMTPRPPDRAEPPKVLQTTITTAILTWTMPPCYNLEPSAFHIQFRVGLRNDWMPHEPISVAPIYRTRVIEGLIPATPYQFRLRALNRMGIGEWSHPSKLTDTVYGLPVEMDRPQVCDATTNSMSFYFFAPHPETYGSAAQEFDIEYCGEGKEYEDYPKRRVTMADGIQPGKDLYSYYHTFIAGVKANVAAYGTKRIKNFGLRARGVKISNSDMEHLLEKFHDETHILLSYEVLNLSPGQAYRIRIRGHNKAGEGPWSLPNFSALTVPKEPDTPAPPHVTDSSLTTILFEWYAPKQNGSAITGYRIFIEHTGRQINLERNELSYLLENLQPGKCYRLKVLAKNDLGWSAYSDWSSTVESHTKIGVPEQPRNLKVLSGTWCTIMLEAIMPFSNGSPLLSFTVQRRWVQPFDKGDWEMPCEYLLTSKHVKITNYVDPTKQQEELYKWACEIAFKKNANKSYNPFEKKDKSAELTPEQILSREKPEGSTLQFEVVDLLSDTVYEFRAAFSNIAGLGNYGGPSRRAKTNCADPPDCCDVPEIRMIMPSSVTLAVTRPYQGGADIIAYSVETRDLDNSTVVLSRYDKRVDMDPFVCVVGSLNSGSTYQFRIRAESLVSNGEFSHWSDDADIPKLPDGGSASLVPGTPLISTSNSSVASNTTARGATGVNDMNIRIPTSSKLSEK